MITVDRFASASPSRIAASAPSVTRKPNTNGRSIRVHSERDVSSGSTTGLGVSGGSPAVAVVSSGFAFLDWVARSARVSAGAVCGCAVADVSPGTRGSSDEGGTSLLMGQLYGSSARYRLKRDERGEP